MKKLLTLTTIIAFSISTYYSQNIEPFSQVDLSEVTSGYLYELSPQISGFEDQTGLTYTVNNHNEARQMYHELYSSTMGQHSIPSLMDLSQQIRSHKEQHNSTPIVIMNYDYHRFTGGEPDTTLITFSNGYYHDVANRTQSPYEERTFVSSLVGSNKIDNTTMSFYIGNEFYFSNKSTTPSIEVDFDNGQGFVPVSLGQTVQINYNSISEKIIKVKLNDSNTPLQSAYKISSTCSAPYSPDLAPWSNPFNPFPWQIGVNGPSGQILGNAYVKYSYTGTPNTLEKPFIFVEGVDFGTDVTPQRMGDFGWCQLTCGGCDDGYSFLYNSDDFIEILRQRGYDIILLDFQDGATFIEYNGLLLVELLNLVNQYKVGNEPSVVAGASMGGQVAKYALSYMEQNYIPHCAREYISFDSPHTGANIPLGGQYMLDFLANDVGNADAITQVNLTLKRPAARQMLNKQAFGPNLSTQFYNDMTNLGYPKQTWNVGIANGNMLGNGMNFNAGGWLLDYDESAFAFIGRVKFHIHALPGNSSNYNPINNVVFHGKMPDWLFGVTSHVTTVSTAVTEHFDNAPGGTTNSIESIAESVSAGLTAEGLPAITNYEPLHCFIPTISSLDLNTSNLFLNAWQAWNQNNSVSPFDVIYGPSSGNERHIEITYPTMVFTLGQILGTEDKLVSPLNSSSLNAGVFNYGRPGNNFIKSVDIENGGKLHVNANLLLEYGQNDPYVTQTTPQQGSHFILKTGDCGTVEVNINQNGELIVGDPSVGNTADVHIRDGSILKIANNGILRINDGSKLVIEHGAKLIYEAGAEIQLLGDDAVLEINGEIILGNNATFTFTHANSNSGYIKFDVPFNPCPPPNVTWECPVITAGSNCRIDLRGDSKTDKILEIADGDLQIPTNIELFRLSFGKAIFGTNVSRLNLGMKRYLLNDASFEGLVTGRGIHVFGTPNSTIVRCDFDQVEIFAQLFYGGNRLNVFSSNFTNGAHIETIGKGVFFNRVDFDNLSSHPTSPYNTYAGWQSIASDFPSNYTYGNINVTTSVGAQGTIHGGGIFNDYAFSSTILQELVMNRANISQFNGELKMKCNTMVGHTIGRPGLGLYFADNAQLRMSYIDGFGFNSINSNVHNISGSEINLLDFEYGFNDFQGGGIRVNYALGSPNIPTIQGGNTNKFFFLTSTDPNTTADNTFSNAPSNPKVLIHKGPYPTFGPPLPSNIIPVSWLLTPTNPPSNPCGTPGGGGGSGNNPTQSPLKVCANCPIVNSPNFNNVKLNDAILIATENMETQDTTKNDITAIELFYEIFMNASFDLNDPDQAFLMNYAYANMKNSLQHCFVTGRIKESDNIPNPHTCVKHFLEVVALRTQTANQNNYADQFFLQVDEALTYRLFGKRSEALNKLHAIDNCYLTQRHREMLKNYINIVSIENDIINGVVPKEQGYLLFDKIERSKPVNTSTNIDPSSSIDPTAVIGLNTTIGANVIIEQNVTIANDVVIEDNVVIKKNSFVGEFTTIKSNTTIEKDVTIGSHNSIGSDGLIKRNVVIGDHNTFGDDITMDMNVELLDYIDVENNVTIKKDVSIGNGAYIGENSRIGKEITIGELSIIRKDSDLKDKVKIGNRNVIAKGAIINSKSKTGKEVSIEENISVPSNKEVCDFDNVANGYNYNNCSNVSPPILVNSTNTCDFAMGYAKTREHFLNGFTISYNKTVSVGEEITFIPNELSSSYSWTFGDCGTSSDEMPIYKFEKPGIYLITLKLSTPCNSEDYYGAITVYPEVKSEISPILPLCTSSDLVTVNRLTTIDITQPACYNQTGCKSYLPLKNENCKLHLEWNLGSNSMVTTEEIDMSSSNLLNDQIQQQYQVNGSYTATLTSGLDIRQETDYEWSCMSNLDEASTDISIESSINPTISMLGCAPGFVQFFVSTSGGAGPYDYDWSFDNGTSTSSLASPLVNILDTGMFAITLTITDQNGCSQELNTQMYISDCNSSARIGNTNNEDEQSSESNQLTDMQSINAYPNPTKGQVTFEYEMGELKGQLILTDMLGKVVLEQNIIGSNKLTVDLSNHPKGVFLYRVITDKGVIDSNKIVLVK